MSKAKPKSSVHYAQWVLWALRRFYAKHSARIGGDPINPIDEHVASMRADRRFRPDQWERRFHNSLDAPSKEPIPYFLLLSLVACAYSVAAEIADQGGNPEKAWEHALTAAWWAGLFGGHMDHHDYIESKRKVYLEKAAARRHAENRDMKKQARDWYSERRTTLSKDAAAGELAGKVLPVAFRTVRDWLKN